MRKPIVLLTFVAIMAALFVGTATAQLTGSIKGVVKDENGAPMAGIEVVYQGIDNGRKYSLKTNKGGQYFSMGVQQGSYNITVMRDGQQVYSLKGVPVRVANENVYDIDLSKEKARMQSEISPEEKKRQEEIAKQNLKIKGLNEKLQQAKAAEDAGNFDQAIAIMTEATQMDPNRDVLWARLGEANLGAKKYGDAAEAYKKAIALAPTRAEYHNNLGQAYVKDRKTDEAIAEYNQAATLDPPNAGTYFFNLGAVLTNQGKVDDAIAAFDKAIAADPNKADAYYWKGVNMIGKATLDKSGKMVAPEGTADMFNKYLSLQPEGQFAQPSKDMLASIGATIQTSFGTPKGAKKK